MDTKKIVWDHSFSENSFEYSYQLVRVEATGRASKRNITRRNKTALGPQGQAEISLKIEDLSWKYPLPNQIKTYMANDMGCFRDWRTDVPTEHPFHRPCNQCLSPLALWVRTPFRRCVLDTTLYDKVCQWFAASRCFFRVLWFTQPIKKTATI